MQIYTFAEGAAVELAHLANKESSVNSFVFFQVDFVTKNQSFSSGPVDIFLPSFPPCPQLRKTSLVPTESREMAFSPYKNFHGFFFSIWLCSIASSPGEVDKQD